MTLLVQLVLGLLAAWYARRWCSVRGANPDEASVGRLLAFMSGLVSLWVAVASPLAQLDRWHLTAHMIQHLLIMTIAAPLLLLGEPVRILASGRQPVSTVSLAWSFPHPALCWLAGTLVVLVWHVPSVFELGMRWHGLQHFTFLVGGLLFWLPVLEPYPFQSRWPRWSVPLYLFLASLPCDVLSAFLAFCDRVVYAHYDAHCGPMALEDQQRAGALMWFWVTIAYLVPATLVTVDLLTPRARERLRPARG
ncbi:MAG: cytochrome c oxidase assembly protein [Polyangiaceae bacterium]